MGALLVGEVCFSIKGTGRVNGGGLARVCRRKHTVVASIEENAFNLFRPGVPSCILRAQGGREQSVFTDSEERLGGASCGVTEA